MIVDNDPGAGKPRTSSDEKSVSLVADALEVRGEFTVNRSTVSRWDNVKNFLEPRKQKLCRKMHKK